MCLSKVHSIGYQVFRKGEHGHLYPAYQQTDYTRNCGRLSIPTEKWQTDGSASELRADNDTPYAGGFHIFLRLIDAEAFLCRDTEVIRKVKFDEIVAFGEQKFCTSYGTTIADTVVARRRFVHREDL